MGDYVLQIRYPEGEAPIRVRLSGLSPEEAEFRRQALVRAIREGVDMHAPPVPLAQLDPELPGDVTVDPGRVTEVDLLDADTVPE